MEEAFSYQWYQIHIFEGELMLRNEIELGQQRTTRTGHLSASFQYSRRRRSSGSVWRMSTVCTNGPTAALWVTFLHASLCSWNYSLRDSSSTLFLSTSLFSSKLPTTKCGHPDIRTWPPVTASTCTSTQDSGTFSITVSQMTLFIVWLVFYTPLHLTIGAW